MPGKNALATAVQHLYGTGVINKDKDIADKTGYNKATVSSYLSGKIAPSSDFLQSFEKAFRVSVKDFDKGGKLQPIAAPNPMQLLTEKMIQLTAINRVNQSLLIEVLANQSGKTVMELQRVVSAAMDAEIKQLLDELRREQV